MVLGGRKTLWFFLRDNTSLVMSRTSEGSSQLSDVLVFGRGGVLQVRAATADPPRPKSNPSSSPLTHSLPLLTPFFTPPSPLPCPPHPSRPLLPSCLLPDRLWRNAAKASGTSCLSPSMRARVVGHVQLWFVQEFCVPVTHHDAPWRGSDCPACKKPSPEDGTMASGSSAQRFHSHVLSCRRSRRRSAHACFCVRWANTIFGCHSTSTPF